MVGVKFGYPRLPNSLLPDYHKITILGVWIWALFTYILACTKRPGHINRETMHIYDNYKYDNMLYEEGKECSTCLVRKLPRSKHCRVCNNCVPRFDHHCGWINQCVGEGNYKFFILFLFVRLSISIFTYKICLCCFLPTNVTTSFHIEQRVLFTLRSISHSWSPTRKCIR